MFVGAPRDFTFLNNVRSTKLTINLTESDNRAVRRTATVRSGAAHDELGDIGQAVTIGIGTGQGIVSGEAGVVGHEVLEWVAGRGRASTDAH